MNDFVIPKTIHFCWFSGEAYPPEIIKCMQSWKDILPDFTIRIWTIDDAKRLGIPFINEALSVKKWAFAADVVRLYALYSEGGVYMDTDIIVKQRFDEFMTNELTLFVENHPNDQYPKCIDHNGLRIASCPWVPGLCIQAAFMIGRKGHPFMKRLLEHYRNLHFILPDGKLYIQPDYPIAPDIYALEAERNGFRYIDIQQELDEGIVVYPSRFVASHPRFEQPSAFAIHNCAQSWCKKKKKRNRIKDFILAIKESLTCRRGITHNML